MPKRPDLDPAGLAYYKTVTKSWDLDDHQQQILIEACRSLDRAEQARAAIGQDGAFVADRYGCLRAHPAVAVERDHRGLFARLVRELGLQADSSDSRPPSLSGRYQHRS